jgi:hypothetical protein
VNKNKIIYNTRKEIIILFCALIVAALIGCESSLWKQPDRSHTIANASYDISLLSVERSTGTEKVYAKQKVETVFEEGIPKFYFEDEMVRIKWRPAPHDIVFVVHNKADNPVKIVWDEGKFIDEKGVTHRLLHSGIGYEERNDFHPPTIIYAKDTLEDFVYPADYWQKEESSKKSHKNQGYWKRGSFLPTQTRGTAEELRTKAEPFVGKTFQVVLTLQINGVRNDYICTFIVNNVDVTEKEQQPEKNPNDGGSRRGNRRGAF